MHDDFHIDHANIDATYRQKLAVLSRSDFDNLSEDDITHPFYVSSARLTRTGAKPTRDSLKVAKDILLQELAPTIKGEEISWSFTVRHPAYETTFTTASHEYPGPLGSIEAVSLLMESVKIGLRGELAISEEEIELTLIAPLVPSELRTIMESTLAAVANSLRPASVIVEIPSTDHSYALTSAVVSLTLMQNIEEYCLKRASAALENELACVRSLLAVKTADKCTYASTSALASWHKEFPPGVREVKFCGWFFTSQEQGDGYLPSPESLKGILVEVFLTRKTATLHVQGSAKQASALGSELRKGILTIVNDSTTNCRFAHSNLINCIVMILGVALAFAAAVVFEKHTGVLITAGLTGVAAYLYPFLIPRLFPYIIFENAESSRRRRAILRVCKFMAFGIFAPVIVEVFSKGT